MKTFFKITLFSLLLVLTLAPSAFAQSDLKSYTERLLSNFDQEIDTVNSFVDVYQRADFQNDFSISTFQSSLPSYRNKFNGYLKSPPELPALLAQG